MLSFIRRNLRLMLAICTAIITTWRMHIIKIIAHVHHVFEHFHMLLHFLLISFYLKAQRARIISILSGGWELLRLGYKRTRLSDSAVIIKTYKTLFLNLIRRARIFDVVLSPRGIMRIFNVDCEGILPKLFIFIQIDVVLADFFGVVQLFLKYFLFEIGYRLRHRNHTIRNFDGRIGV